MTFLTGRDSADRQSSVAWFGWLIAAAMLALGAVGRSVLLGAVGMTVFLMMAVWTGMHMRKRSRWRALGASKVDETETDLRP